MSIRAHKVITLKYETSSSFNVTRNDELARFWGFNSNGGLEEVSIREVEMALLQLELREDVVKSLKRDLADAKKKGQDWIQYYCF